MLEPIGTLQGQLEFWKGQKREPGITPFRNSLRKILKFQFRSKSETRAYSS